MRPGRDCHRVSGLGREKNGFLADGKTSSSRTPRNRPRFLTQRPAWGENLLFAASTLTNPMNSDPSGKQNLPGKARRQGVDLNVSDPSKPADVPVFNCIVYVSADA